MNKKNYVQAIWEAGNEACILECATWSPEGFDHQAHMHIHFNTY